MPADGHSYRMITAMIFGIDQKISRRSPGLCSGDMVYFLGNWQSARTWRHRGGILFVFFEPLRPAGKSGADVLSKDIMESNSAYLKQSLNSEMLKKKISRTYLSPLVLPTR